jgi:hypothetical protein
MKTMTGILLALLVSGCATFWEDDPRFNDVPAELILMCLEDAKWAETTLCKEALKDAGIRDN